jgi:alpha-galactosidase
MRRARREPLTLVVAGALVLLGCVHALAVKPTAAEIARSRTWLTNAAADGTASLPFSFTYGGRPSAEVLSGWTFDHTVRRLARRRTEHTLQWGDPETGLVVRFVAVQYGRFPTLEWTLHFENTGSADTPILEAIQALDMRFERGATGEFLLHHNVGSPTTRSDYAPIETPLPPGAIMRLAGLQGRPTTANLSYFNLAWDGEGVIVVVGWPGQWAAEFAREGDRGVRIRAGQELTHFRLRPGEEVRTPLVVLQAWQGDWMRGQNVWRRWMTVHNVPRPGGRLPRPQLLGTSFRATALMSQTDEADQIMEIDRYREEGLRIDAWWMDAGWYPAPDGWFETGTWEVDPVRFPRGLRPISDHAHAHHVKTLLWFEPERVSVGTWLADNRPEWVIGGRAGGLLDLGNPEAWRWVVDRVDGLVTDNRIDIYRQDFNIDPLLFWRTNDAPDRQGITEIRHVEGYLALWDELRRRHPRMLTDACASGGRRNDLETMRRAVPLWRSDHAYDPAASQGMTYGLAAWLPYYGTGTVAKANAPDFGGGWTPVEPYAFWSDTAPSLVSDFDVRVGDLDYAALRTLFGQWRRIGRFYSGDFYPLTPYSLREEDWMAWQFHRTSRGDGMVQAFRRTRCSEATTHLRLRDLDPDRRYRVRELDGASAGRLWGRDLMERGLTVTVPEQPGATVVLYRAEPAS